ncbi:hypothetical protein, partial [Plantactinospora endophytica]|uniref:hypothetical protein n=1 Tax=Plantactinospora endophytica TaxID=673535 RepID=UPI0036350A35
GGILELRATGSNFLPQRHLNAHPSRNVLAAELAKLPNSFRDPAIPRHASVSPTTSMVAPSGHPLIGMTARCASTYVATLRDRRAADRCACSAA